jgi:hypothetical protein
MPHQLELHKFMKLALMLTLLAIGIQVNKSAQAAPHATYTLVQSYIGPSGSGSAGVYTISSSIGQPTAGEVSGGIYTFGGGFWGGGVIVPVQTKFDVFLPLMLR